MKYTMTGAIAVLYSCVANPCLAQDAQQAGTKELPYDVRLLYNLGTSGLLDKLFSYSNYSEIQGRIGLSRAQIANANSTGILSGYEDSTTIGAAPFNFIHALPLGDGQHLVRFGGFLTGADGASGNLTESDSVYKRLELQYLYAPTTQTLFGAGIFAEKNSIDLKHQDGDTERSGWGLRFDLATEFSQNWGITGRAEINFGQSKTSIPLGDIGDYRLNQDDRRFYSEVNLVGNFTAKDFDWLPPNWAFNPSVMFAYQRTSFDAATDSFGNEIRGTVGKSDEYAVTGINARFSSLDYRPYHIAPYVQVGLQREIINDLDAYLKEPTYLQSIVGVTTALGATTFLNLEYQRNDGLRGKRDDQIVTLNLTSLF